MILVIDNYDSFVYNLARYIERLGGTYDVHRNDDITIEEIRKKNPEAIIISPGPCKPENAGISKQIIKELGSEIPILGVCLGHQAIGEVYGGKTVKAAKPVHGKSAMINHSGTDLFQDIPNPLKIGRYHSLISELPENTDLQVTARTDEGEIMAMQHKTHPVFGVQFHPESVLTPAGVDVLYNFLTMAHNWNLSKDNTAAQSA